jgi:hypothetical protein
MTTHIYLGFIKINVSDGVRLIFVFIESYFIKLYDIFGSELKYGNYNSFSYITQQEIALLLENNKHMEKLEYKGKTNKDYYRSLKELDKRKKDYRYLFEKNIKLHNDS